jgi:hypothetical protein
VYRVKKTGAFGGYKIITEVKYTIYRGYDSWKMLWCIISADSYVLCAQTVKGMSREQLLETRSKKKSDR